MLMPLLALPALVLACWALSRYVLIPLLMRSIPSRACLFLATLGWCLGIAELAHALNLSHEMGAFVAGVTLAANRVATFIAESLKPLRDFFLILFFFALGAEFPIADIAGVVIPAIGLAAVVMAAKIWGYGKLLVRNGEKPKLAREVGVRLGQASEYAACCGACTDGTGDQRAACTSDTGGDAIHIYCLVLHRHESLPDAHRG